MGILLFCVGVVSGKEWVVVFVFVESVGCVGVDSQGSVCLVVVSVLGLIVVVPVVVPVAAEDL